MCADQKAQVRVICPYNKEQHVLFRLLHFVNLAADKRLQFVYHRAKRDSVHCHLKNTPYLAGERGEGSLFLRRLEPVEDDSIAARAVFQAAVDTADGCA